eukprot:scaffold31_cov334-Pavlova_lutheri.AAC.28
MQARTQQEDWEGNSSNFGGRSWDGQTKRDRGSREGLVRRSQSGKRSWVIGSTCGNDGRTEIRHHHSEYIRLPGNAREKFSPHEHSHCTIQDTRATNNMRRETCAGASVGW